MGARQRAPVMPQSDLRLAAEWLTPEPLIALATPVTTTRMLSYSSYEPLELHPTFLNSNGTPL